MEVVSCPSCGEENPARFRLCGFCGTALAPPETVRCPACNEENPGRFRMCGFCGTTLSGATPLTAAPAPVPAPVAVPAEPELGGSEVRKPATFIFVDLKGSTALTERIDQEAMNEIKKRYFTVMSAQIERHGGTIEKYIGDAIMAVFGIPRAHEDDALRAVRAAHGMQQELHALNVDFLQFYGVELANRTGVNTGEVVANTDPNANQQLATGDTVNVAARLEQAAPANEILIGETTYDLVRGQVEVEAVEPLELKGKSERVPAYRLVRIRDAGETVSAETVRAAPLVGRQMEWTVLQDAFDSAVAAQRCQVTTVLGDPGVGKTRLVKEFTDAHAVDAQVLKGRCLPYGDGITFWPLAEVARGAAGITDEDPPDAARLKLSQALDAAGPDAPRIVERMAAAMGLSAASFPVPELFWGGRRLLETLAAARPVIVVVDDLHWAQPTFLEFLEHLATASTTAPLMVLTTARHALLEAQPDWAARSGGAVIPLAPLTADDAGGLVDHLLGQQGIDETIRSKVVASADGNPLFVEQLVSMLVDKGLLRRVDGTWQPTEQLVDLAVPPTISALLASRLDDLSREERAVVEPASVIGLVFFEPAIEEMVPQVVRPAVARHLGTLDDKQFVARDTADPDEETYRFRHGLIREATYGSLLKRTRAVLHEQFVGWAERVNKERGREQEFEEILGFHLEQSFRYRTELGPLDDTGRDLARRAAEKLGNAGRRAFLRGDLPAASSLLRRAADVLPPGTVGRLELLAEAVGALAESGEFDEARRLASSGAEDPGIDADVRGAARLRLASIDLDLFGSEESSSLDDTISSIEALRAVLEEHGDPGGVARAWRSLMVIHGTAGRLAATTTAADEVVRNADLAEDARIGGRGAMGYVSSAVHGPRPVAEVLPRCEALLERVHGDRTSEATIQAALAQLCAMDGDLEHARELTAQYRATLSELGPSVSAASTSLETSRVDLLWDQADAAERDLRRDYDDLGRLGERYFRSTIGAILARVLAILGRSDEAAALSVDVEALADPDDPATQVIWRLARARAQADLGDLASATALADEAIALADDTPEYVIVLADAYLDVGDVRARAGDAEGARAAWQHAGGLYAEKGDVVSAAAIERRLT